MSCYETENSIKNNGITSDQIINLGLFFKKELDIDLTLDALMIKVHKLKTNPYFLLLSHKIEFADKKKIIDEVYRIIRWFDEVLKTTIKSDDIVYGEQY